MAGKKASGENTKKAAGNARKAESAAQKQAAEDAKRAKADEEQWSKGAKSNAKKEADAAKKADAARKKAEKDALLAEEEASIKSAKPANSKAAASNKKTRGGTLDMSSLDGADAGAGATEPSSSSGGKAPSLNASGISNALDALALTSSPNQDKVDRHPERRFKAAYAAYEARRLPQLEEETKGLRRQQRIEIVRKEFEKSPENPFNQATNVRFDASKEEIQDIKMKARMDVEARLAGD